MRPLFADAISAANARVYDRLATVYDSLDSRRAKDQDWSWLEELLKKYAVGPVFLDAGAGSGLLSKRASPYFEELILLDISKAMLDRICLPRAQKIVGDCGDIPLPNETVDFVGAFATLHHLFDPVIFFREAYRVLRQGGILYTDHDIESSFVRKFRLPLRLYRTLFDHGQGYLKACPELTQEDYDLSEYHGRFGLNAQELCGELTSIGFQVVEKRFHWEGMGTPTQFLKKLGLQEKLSTRGWGPVFRFVAVKS